ncbi:MAG: stealth conserved region 3 domain-containing protein [Clostridia bacterium]|nr:stealth conserved region 3 domain-containing protein [Clostridia bacterium]
MENYKIDFVMIWVDGGDPEWIKSKNFHSGKKSSVTDDRDARYRDWENLKYWFRAVEKFAPWVNHVYFITCGHVPEWLNLDYEKITHIRHEDYMPEEYLPTFSSHPIELCINRIKELSEHFVYFNDDMFITRPVKPELFFRNGKPVHSAHLHCTRPGKVGNIMPHIYLNSTEVINSHIDMKKSLSDNKKKWFSVRKNGIKTIAENLICSNYQMWPGFTNEHVAVPLLKSTLDEVWRLEPDKLDRTCRHKFRDVRDVSQYTFRYWQLASGNFEPEKAENLGIKIEIGSNDNSLKKMCDAIENQKYNLVCVNDDGHLQTYEDFEYAKNEINKSFDKILPEKSLFER